MTNARAVRLLKTLSILTIVVGLVAALGAADATDVVWARLFDVLDWPIDDDPSGFDDRGRQLNAVLGGVMVGWGVLMFRIVTDQFVAGNRQLALPMAVSVATWFAVDSIGSIAAGLPGNVVLNLIFVVLYLPPLIHLHRQG